MRQSKSCMISVTLNHTPSLPLLFFISACSSPVKIPHVLCEWKYPACGRGRAGRPTSVVFRRLRKTTASASSPSRPPPTRAQPDLLFSPWPRSHGAVGLNMSNIRSVNVWWKSKVIILSEFQRGILPFQVTSVDNLCPTCFFLRPSVCSVIHCLFSNEWETVLVECSLMQICMFKLLLS